MFPPSKCCMCHQSRSSAAVGCRAYCSCAISNMIWQTMSVFMQAWGFDDERLSVLFGLVKEVHDASVQQRLTIERSFAFFKDTLLNHSVHRWEPKAAAVRRPRTVHRHVRVLCCVLALAHCAAVGSAIYSMQTQHRPCHPNTCPVRIVSSDPCAACMLDAALLLLWFGRPPFSCGVFSQAEMQAILDWMLNTYYKHYKLYQYVFTKR